MGFKQITRILVGASAKRSAYHYFTHTADLSAFAGCSSIPLNLLKLIIGGGHRVLIRAPLRFAEASTGIQINLSKFKIGCGREVLIRARLSEGHSPLQTSLSPLCVCVPVYDTLGSSLMFITLATWIQYSMLCTARRLDHVIAPSSSAGVLLAHPRRRTTSAAAAFAR